MSTSRKLTLVDNANLFTEVHVMEEMKKLGEEKTDENKATSYFSISYRVEYHPVGCICLYKSDSGAMYVGWSLCSKSDQFSYAKGKEIAYQRALKAKEGIFISQEDMSLFERNDLRVEVASALSNFLYNFNMGRY